MSFKSPVLALVSLAILPAESALAKQALSIADTQGGAKAKLVTVKVFTVYTPAAGGMNGNCGGGALQKLGVHICKQLLEPHVRKQGPKYVAAAVPCIGGNAANAFGGVYAAPEVANILGVSANYFVIGAVDHYKCGGSGKGGKGGSNYTENMDVAVEKESGAEAEKIKKASGAQLHWIGTFEEFRAGRLPEQDPEVGSPLGEFASGAEELLQEAIYQDRIGRIQGRHHETRQAWVASGSQLPWAIFERKNPFRLSA